MIKNIVFDMGKVLVGYDAMRVCEHYIEDEHDRKRVHTAVFVSPEWVMMDMGLLTDNQALLSICKRLPERLHDVAALCLRDWHKYCMWTYTEMEAEGKGFWYLFVFQCSDPSFGLLQGSDSGSGLF